MNDWRSKTDAAMVDMRAALEAHEFDALDHLRAYHLRAARENLDAAIETLEAAEEERE